MTAGREHGSVGVLGCGNLGRALVGGLVGAGRDPATVGVTTDPPEGALAVAAELGVRAYPDNVALVRASDVLVLAVKPGQVTAVCGEIADALGDRPLVTCAAGVPTAALTAALRPGALVGRAMPNVAARVRQGSAALWLPPGLHDDRRAACRAVFEASGTVVDLPDESLFDVATALVGSGPAFTCVFVEALADGAVQSGMPRDLALALAESTVRGAAALLEQSGEHPAVWKDRVTSPGGTTAAGLYALERGGLRAAAMEAIGAATRRATALGGKK